MCISDETISPAVDGRLRHLARKQGYSLQKSRARSYSINNLGRYRIVDPDQNRIVAGERFDLTPTDVEAWLLER